MLSTFAQWTKGRTIECLATNKGAMALPFQQWRRFKEAFAPELVDRAFRESKIPVKRCLDPFGGSGTTALASQFLGVEPTTFEVNPYLCDLIASKVTEYDCDALARDFGAVMRNATRNGSARRVFGRAPVTFLEPGRNGRWLFDYEVACRIAGLLRAIERLTSSKHRRLFRVLLGGGLVDLSNIVTSGKGRRYRKHWEERRILPGEVDRLFAERVESAICEIHRFRARPEVKAHVICGDARTLLKERFQSDIAIFSPPYPNSFDYTDVYNVELWALGYLTNGDDNADLRRSTLCSHVQLLRQFATPPSGSNLLRKTLIRLDDERAMLWNHHIPEMVGTYFADMLTVLRGVSGSLSRGGSAWLVVGDSQYHSIHIKVAKILAELADEAGFAVVGTEPFRSMRSSAQQGGEANLAETLLILRRR